jgi:hypothetical protein
MAFFLPPPVKSYDPARCFLSLNGLLIGGYAPDSFITVTRSADTYNYLIGLDGEFIRTQNKDKSGIISLTLTQGADSNTLLSTFQILDEQGNAGAFNVFLQIFDGNTVSTPGSTYGSPVAFVLAPARAEFARKVSTREWRILCNPLFMQEKGLGAPALEILGVK